jgi:hypothetical protein
MQKLNGFTKRMIDSLFFKTGYFPDEILLLTYQCYECKLKPEKYLRYLVPLNLFGTKRTREILSQNPTIIPLREDSKEIKITIYDYNAEAIEVHEANRYKGMFQIFIAAYYYMDQY